MTGGAIAVARVGHVVRGRLRGNTVALSSEIPLAVVAFQAESEHRRPSQQGGVHRSMWCMADLAAVDTDRSMLKGERPPFVGMAFHAGLFRACAGFDHPRSGSGAPNRGTDAMGIMTVGASDRSFIDAVLDRHRELSTDVRVAVITQQRLTRGEQELRRWRPVDRMTVGANHFGGGVGAAADVCSWEVFAVAGEAGFERLRRRH